MVAISHLVGEDPGSGKRCVVILEGSRSEETYDCTSEDSRVGGVW